MRPCLPLLLHMHQPDYIDPVSGEPVMPWVRKHALRDQLAATIKDVLLPKMAA